MSATPQPPKLTTLDNKIDEMLQELATGFALSSGTFWSPDDGVGSHARATAKQAIKDIIVSELVGLIDRQDIAWVRRGDIDSHEMFVYTNIIFDRIKQIKGDDS